MKKLIAVILVITLTFALFGCTEEGLGQLFSGLNQQKDEPCVTHKDESGDGACDICGETLTEKEPEEDEYAFVTQVFNNGNADEKISVKIGKPFTAPQAPKKTGHVFLGWYSDSFLLTPYDFSASVTGDLTIYAKWAPDMVYIGNKVATETVFSCLRIENYKYNNSRKC